MTEEQIMTGEMKMTEGDWKESELIHIKLENPPTWVWDNDYPDVCKDCLHRGRTIGTMCAKPYCQYYHVVLKKDTLEGDCKYRSTKVGE